MYNAVEFLNSASKIVNDLTPVVENHRNLEKKYIKSSNYELLSNLNKETRIVLSYLNGFENSNLKNIKACLKEVSAYGDLESIKKFSSPKKKIDFITIAHKQGKWSIASDKLSNKLENLDVPTAMDYLTQIVARLTPQEAAYSLVHAKDNGTFIMAALPYSTIEEGKSGFGEQPMKTPNYPLGDPRDSYVGPYNYSTPVSRQMAAADDVPSEVLEEENEIRSGSLYIDEEDVTYTITGIEDGMVFIDKLEEPLTEEQIKSLIDSGKWKRMAAKDSVKEKKMLEDLERHTKSLEEFSEWNLAILQMTKKYQADLQDAVSSKMERLQKDIEKFQPKIQKNLSILESLQRKASSIVKKLTILKQKVGSVVFTYSPEIEEYQQRSKSVEEIREVLEKIKTLISKKDLSTFEQYAEEMFKWTSRSESFKFDVDQKDPRVKEEIEQKVDYLSKRIKNSLNRDNGLNKKETYNKLDKMLFAGLMDFETYNKFCNCVEKNASLSKQVVDDVCKILTNKPIYVKSAAFDKVKEKFSQFWNKIKDLTVNLFNFITLKDSQFEEVDSELDKIIEGME